MTAIVKAIKDNSWIMPVAGFAALIAIGIAIS